MPPLDDAGLGPGERAAIDAAFARDPALLAEAELIAAALAEDRRTRFCRSLAAEAANRARPAAAVLAALERAARPR
jgi:hypothetical protein